MNPYSTPQNPAFDVTTEHPDLRSLPILKNLVTSWEKIRIFYNLTIAAPLIIILTQAISKNLLPTSELITTTILLTLGANACYFAGPLVELYLCAVSQRPPARNVHYSLVIAGFAFSVIFILWFGIFALPTSHSLVF